MKNARKLSCLLLVLCMILGLAACGSSNDTSSTPSSAANQSATQSTTADASAVGSGDKIGAVESNVVLEDDEITKLIEAHTTADGKTFINWATAKNCASFEPYKSIKNTNAYGKPIYESLFSRVGVGGEYIPVIAESVEKTDDYTWRVKIKDYVYDSAGENIKASDVYFSYMTIAKGTYNNGYFRQLEDIIIVDDYTVDIKMSTKSEALFQKMSYNYIWSEKSFTSTGDNMATQPIGTGPYVVTDWVSGNHVTYEKRDDYWEKDPAKIAKTSQANVDIMNYNIIKDEAQMAIALQNGTNDMCEDLTEKNLSFFEGTDGYQVFSDSDNKTLLCAFNCNPEYSPCGDVNLRKAIMYALDRDAIVIGLYGGKGTVAKGPSSFTLADFNPDWLNNDYYSYDLDKAKECLKASGYNNEELNIMVEDEDLLNKGALIMQNCLEEIGVKSKVTSVENAMYTTYRYDPTQYDIQFMTSGGSDYAMNSWIQNCDTSAVGTSNMGVEDLVLYEMLLKAIDGCPDDQASIDAVYNYLTDNCMYIGIANGTKSIVTNDIVTKCVTEYAQYLCPACCEYVWNK